MNSTERDSVRSVGPAGQARINPGTGHSSPVLRRNRAGAAPRFAGDEAFGSQALQRPPDRDPGHRKLLHQRKFTGHPVGETPLFELLAQHPDGMRMREIAEALDIMTTEHDLLHLDIKPQNLFLMYNHIKIGDLDRKSVV